MAKGKLDWDNFDWGEFQRLSISIAETIVPDCNFSEYLKHGQKQEGIDLIAFKRKNGKFYCIQCKREIKLILSDLKLIIKEFQEGVHFKVSSNFTLVTSVDLQKPNLLKYLNETKLEFYEKYKIELEFWDIHKIEKELKSKKELVAYYFGKQKADEFCIPQLRNHNFKNIEPIIDYIPRQITKFSNVSNDGYFYSRNSFKETYDLKEIILNNPTGAKHICIIADSHQGKSCYIKQTAFELLSVNNGVAPILIEIKSYNVQPIETLLMTLYGFWEQIPLKNIVLIIDGLDEVPTDKFEEMIKYIHEFNQSYRPVSIIFSCRKLFFNKYDVSSILNEFDIYDLAPLQSEDIETFLKMKLDSSYENFISSVNTSRITTLLYHPLYLINIVSEYLIPPHKLPNSKSQIIEDLIAKSFKLSEYRKTNGSESLKDEIVVFKKVIEKFAFSLQLAGLNAFSDEEVQELFDKGERMLLQHNSLITHSAKSWSFTNALFQEHIAALLLSKIDFEHIISYCTVGGKIKKIKLKWLQTISSLISMLEPNSEKLLKVLELIEDDNIELLFETESTKYDDEQKFILLKKLIKRSINQNIRTLIVGEDSIGLFIESSDKSKEYLLDCLLNNGLTEIVKILVSRIINSSSLNEFQIKRFIDIAINQLEQSPTVYYASNLIQILSSHKAGNEKLIYKLISFDTLNQHHEYRDKIYELLNRLDIIDDFYSYGKDGMPFFRDYNKDISLGGSEYNLEAFLLGSKKPQNLTSLLTLFIHDDWKWYFNYSSISVKAFLESLFDKLADKYEEYPYQILHVANFIKEIGRDYYREDYKMIDNYLERTNSYWLIIRILIKHILEDTNWEMGTLITYESYDYILFEHDERTLDLAILRTCCWSLRRKQKEEIADTFYEMCVDATEGKLINNENKYDSDFYHEVEKKKNKNDLIYIQSKEAFIKGVKKYFKAHGKNSISEDDLYVDIDGNRGNIKKTAESRFIFNYLSNNYRGNSYIHLNECLKELNEDNYFDTFRANEILNYYIKHGNSEKIFLAIIKEFYHKYLSIVNFKNNLTKGINYGNLEFTLGEIFKKYKFDTPEEYLMELVCLDPEGIKENRHYSSKNETISDLILKKLSESGKIKFRNKIIENLKFGIYSSAILHTHLSLCKHLKIIEAKNLILDYIKKIFQDGNIDFKAIDIYLELGGDANEILLLYLKLKDYNNSPFSFLSVKLYKLFPSEVSTLLIKLLNNDKVSKESKIQFSQLLSEIGFFIGFAHLINEIRVNKISPVTIQGQNLVACIDTNEGLKEMQNIMYFLIDDNYSSIKSFHDSARSIIIEWIFAFAAKSEHDLILVLDFLESIKIELSQKYTDVSNLNWNANKCVENFRNSDNTIRTVSEIKKIISTF